MPRHCSGKTPMSELDSSRCRLRALRQGQLSAQLAILAAQALDGVREGRARWVTPVNGRERCAWGVEPAACTQRTHPARSAPRWSWRAWPCVPASPSAGRPPRRHTPLERDVGGRRTGATNEPRMNPASTASSRPCMCVLQVPPPPPPGSRCHLVAAQRVSVTMAPCCASRKALVASLRYPRVLHHECRIHGRVHIVQRLRHGLEFRANSGACSGGLERVCVGRKPTRPVPTGEPPCRSTSASFASLEKRGAAVALWALWWCCCGGCACGGAVF